jgi:AGCS family alanine or glycine:cation symporter
MTALVIVITGVYEQEGAEGVALTSESFETVIPWFPAVLSVAVLLFAYSTMLAWSYYGAKATAYLFKESRRADLAFKLVFCLFVVVGSSTSLDPSSGSPTR